MNAMPAMIKHFNVAGPCDPARHYMLPPLERLPEVRRLVEEGHYFILHAARQSGKTTFLQSLADAVNEDGRFHALYCSLESLQGVEDMAMGAESMVMALRLALSQSHSETLRRNMNSLGDVAPFGTTGMITMALSNLCRALDKRLILFFDEADCLSGPTLITFLRQVRNGFVTRAAAPFPWSLALVGMRDLRDYKAQVRAGGETLGSSSPFNIVTRAFTLTNFTPGEINLLYQQHTDATGQIFEPAARERAYYWTEGQPWLVNALARQVVDDDLDRDYSRPITAALIDAAADTLMKRRDTHIDSLIERLKEPRVRAVVEPVLDGGPFTVDPLHDDTRFCIDLGLLTEDPKEGLRPSNPIYRDVMVRILTYGLQLELPPSLERRWMDGKRLDMTGLLKEFQRFWRENSEAWVERYDYKEAAPHLILQAFLQRVVNGGAHIDREFALGRGRVDLCVTYQGMNYPLELKLTGRRAREEGLEQTAGYMATCGAKEGWLVIFDRDPNKSWDDKITWTTENLPDGKVIHVVGC